MSFYNGMFGSSATATSISDAGSLDEVIDFNGVPTASDFADGVLYIKDTNTDKLYQLYNGSSIELNSNKVDRADFDYEEFYNGLVDAGLRSAIPGNALTDEDGSILFDEDGNYIIEG